MGCIYNDATGVGQSSTKSQKRIDKVLGICAAPLLLPLRHLRTKDDVA